MADDLPLAGTKVLELTTVIAGPATVRLSLAVLSPTTSACTRAVELTRALRVQGGLLADWGADVIRVEPPGGDGFRQMYKGTPGLEASAPSQLSPGFCALAAPLAHANSTANVARALALTHCPCGRRGQPLQARRGAGPRRT